MSDVDDTTLEAQEAADAAEWDSAYDKFDSEKGLSKGDEKPPVDDKPKGDEKKEYTNEELLELAKKEQDEAAEKKRLEEEEARKNETPEEKAAREQKEADEAAADKAKQDAEAEERARQQAARDARSTQRDILVETEAMTNDIVEQMFKDKDGKLYDADGDEIRTIEDVMALRNPNTGKNFTEDEAGAWLLKATQSVKQEREDALAMAKTYAEVNLTIKDEADTIKDKYGAFLADPKNHGLRDEILQDYLDTLIVDEESGVVTKAPISMVRFYDRALKPYVDAQSQVSEAEKKAEEEAAARKKAEEEAAKARTRNDREDIFDRGTSGRDTLSKEEQEWADAEKSYYGRR